MLSWAQSLYPIPRSLTGDGVRETLGFLSEVTKGLRIHSVRSGSAVFDWAIPQEWKIRDAYIEHLDSGQRFAEFSKLNLHVVGYSEPIDLVMPLEQLSPRIYTQPDQPNWVPYVTSYYKRSWGFCMSEKEKASLPSGDYRVFIDSELFDGEMLYADALIRGKSPKELFFSSYICHPSMANNELSGPVLLAALMNFIRNEIPEPRFSYRFVLVPETIGSLTYLSKHLDDLKAGVVCGFNLTCVGDNRSYTHVESRLGGTLADQALEAAFLGLSNASKYSFLNRDSDERQYCAPGIDLPVAAFNRSKPGKYPEYHTSADNFDVVTAEGLQGSFDVMSTIIRAFEGGLYPKAAVLGEPQLGKRGLYPTTSQKGSYDAIQARVNVLAYADGNHSVFEISNRTQLELATVLNELELLGKAGLIASHDETW